MSARPSFREITDLLRPSARELALTLIGEPNKQGSGKREIRYGRKGSLRVHVAGQRRGGWYDFEAGNGGGPLDLIMRARGCSLEDASKWACDWLGIANEPTQRSARSATARPYQSVMPQAETVAAGEEDDEEEWRKKWRDPQHVARRFARYVPLSGSHVERYLNERGVRAPSGAPLRFSGAETHDESSDVLSALIARIDGPDGAPIGIHRTYLDRKEPRKASVASAKKMLGYAQGGAVRLLPAGETLAIAEGIETALSVWLSTGLPTWAALSADGIRSLVLPPLPLAREIIIACDHDQASLDAANDAAAIWTEEGRTVRIIIALRSGGTPNGYDFNDALMEYGPGAVQSVVNSAQLWQPAPIENGEVVFSGAPLPKGVIRGVEPHFNTKPMAADRVKAEIDRLVREWLEGALLASKVRREIEAAQTKAVANALAENADLDPQINYGIVLTDRKNPLTRQFYRLICGARRDARNRVLEGHGLKSIPAAPRLQIAAGAGSGKTEAIIQAIAGSEKARRAMVHFYVPSHALAGDIAERCRAAGLRVWILRGRGAKDVDGLPMCRKPKLAKRVGELGLKVSAAICKSGATRCEFYDTCRYFRQTSEITGAGVLLMAHEYLTLPKPEGVPAPDLVVVDENPNRALLGQKSLDPEALGEAKHWGQGTAETADFIGVCRKVRCALLEDGPTKAALSCHGLTQDHLQRAASFAQIAVDGTAGVVPSMNESRGLKALEHATPSPRSAIARLLSRLAEENKLDRNRLHGVSVIDGAGRPRIRIHHLKRLNVRRTVSVLHIDADADEEHGIIFWGPYTRHISLPVQRKATIIQAADMTFSKGSLLGRDGTPPREAATVARRLEKVRRFIRAQVTVYGAGKVLVITNRPVRCAVTGETADGTLPPAAEWEGAAVANFGNIRGVDIWKNYRCAIVVGREQAPPLSVEELACAMYCNDPEPLNLTGKYEQRERGYRMADGTKAGAKAWVHPDQRVQRLHEQVREREIGQGIDRLRPVHRIEPAKVFILGSLPVDVTIDRLVAFGDLLRAAELEAALIRRGAIPLSADWLVANEQSLFAEPRSGGKPSKSALEKALREAGLTAEAHRKTPIRGLGITYRSFPVWSLALYRTGKGGPEKRAIVPLSHPDPRAALERQVGMPLTEFRLVKVRVGGEEREANPPREDQPVHQAPRQKPIQSVVRTVQPGEVMPFARHPLAASSEIVVRPLCAFPELVVWDEKGRPAGWSFGLPLPAEYWPPLGEDAAA